MPELPEVNTFQRYFDATSLNKKIVQVEVQDDKIIRNLSGNDFADQLTGRTFIGSYRRGKYLFGHLDNGHHLLLHFGMTGDLNYYEAPEDQTRHERFAFAFENGYRLGFDCPRKFARICYLEDLDAYVKTQKLGEDALRISETDFLTIAENKKSPVKGFLLNQHHLAGVGNLYADEICYQARVHPASPMHKLDLPTKKLLFSKMKSILQYAVNREAHYKAYPEDWLWQWRKEDAIGPDGNSRVRRTKIAGRTTYFAEGWQRKY